MYTILPQEDNPLLRKKAREIPHAKISSKDIQDLIMDMKTLLAGEEYGVALAAPQVGESIRLFIVSGKAVSKREKSNARRKQRNDVHDDTHAMSDTDQVYINPVLLKMSRGKKEKHEGCLSVRGKWGTVPRAEKATVRAYDEHGRLFTRGASGFLAHIFQHELDHLEGILYTDKATDVYEDEQSE
jgi:peptide deformylase